MHSVGLLVYLDVNVFLILHILGRESGTEKVNEVGLMFVDG